MKNKLLIKLGLLAVVLGVVALFLMRGYDWRGAIDSCLALVRDAGPWTFFGAMAVLPALGFPLSPLLLTAGPAFGPVLGLPVVVALTWVALIANVTLSYALARWLLHPPLEELMTRLGHKLPRVGLENHWDITILLRVTPGPPFFVQSYLLGLCRVPVRTYLICSIAVICTNHTAVVVFGEALLQGKGGIVLLALSFLAALGVGTHLLRKHITRSRAALADVG
ncbi:MAG TPA: VTT domain-containing protein [Pseudorhizobium sp.]|nr:VTT domain-containing protein [Pseudorhizobium sp.]